MARAYGKECKCDMTRRYGCLFDKVGGEEMRDVDLTDRRTLKDDDVER